MFNLVKRAAIQQSGAGMSLSDLDRMMDQAYGGQPSYTGKLVSQQTSLAVAAVYACVTNIADDIATLPLYTYRRLPNGREKAYDHYLWDLLILQANPELTAFRFQQMMQMCLLLWGNAYAEIEINGRGQVTSLWPWRPDRVTVKREKEGGPLWYGYRHVTGEISWLPADRMFHLRGPSVDVSVGLNPIDTMRQTVGLSLAIKEHGARYFANGARPLGMLTTTQPLSDKAYERVRRDWSENHQGLDNAHRVAIMSDGLTWVDSGSNMVDAQYIEAQNLTAREICAFYKMPGYRVGLQDKDATKSSIEEQSLEYVLYTLGPWAANWQNQIHCDLLSSRENKQIYTAFDFTNLLRGNHEAMGKWIGVCKQWGILSSDEIREDYLDRNPIPGGRGKDFWEPVNMQPIGTTNGSQDAKPPSMKIVKSNNDDDDNDNDTPSVKPVGKPNGKLNGHAINFQ